jgi:hypothetical protein
MIGGKIARIIHIGPEGFRGSDGEPAFHNTIKLIVEDYKGNERPPRPDRCAVHIEPTNHELEIGDTVWWQGGAVYWTKRSTGRHDVRLQKVGFTYSGESLDLPR